MALRAGTGARLRRTSLRGALAFVDVRLGALLILYAVAAVAAMGSAVASLGTQFMVADAPPGYGEPAAGDHLQSVYRFWLVGHQLEHGSAPWRDPYSFQPLAEPQLTLAGWPFGLAFWPLDSLFGPILAWNLLLLGTAVGAGLLTFAWLRTLALPWAAAALGGLVFAIAPYRLEQSGGHLLGWIAMFVPLALLAVERGRAAETRRAEHIWGAVAAAALVSIPLAGQVHLALGAVPLVLVYAAVRYRFVAAAWCAGGALAALAVGLVIRYTLIAGSAEGTGRSLAEVDEFSAEWTDLVSRRQLGGSEEFVFLGWLTPVLALAGLFLLGRRRRGLAVVLGAAAVIPVLLALGTNLPLYSVLWHALPPLQFPRVPARLVPLADLALAALAAVAATHVIGRLRARGGLVAATLFVAVAADLAVQPLESAPADPRNEAYHALASAPPGRVLNLPLFEPGVHYASVYDYYALQAPRERVDGYSTLAPASTVAFYFRMNRLSCGVWLPGDEQELEALGVSDVLFHRGMYAQAREPGAWFAWRELQNAGYRAAARGGAVTLFRRGGSNIEAAPVAEPARDRPVMCHGWRGAAMIERQAPFWIHGGGTLEVHVTAPGATMLRVWVDSRELAPVEVFRARTFVVPLGVERWHPVVLEGRRLFPTKPPRALRLERLILRPA